MRPKHLGRAISVAIAIAILASALAIAGDLPDIQSVPQDLTKPAITKGPAAAGLRVRETTPGWEETAVYHAVYLPRNWKAGASYPVIFEYGGNGGFHDAFGDTCDGTVESCNLGYGLSAGLDYIWVCLPFVQSKDGKQTNARQWWGEPAETIRYCLATARYVCATYGGDDRRLVLCGFSRGAIACNYIGLRDSTIAPVWRAFLCHSHYDGVLRWPYADSDRNAAITRLRRLAGRPQFISAEGTLDSTRRFIEASGVRAPFTFVEFPYRNHTDSWALRDCELRRAARAWLGEVTRTSLAK